MIFVTVGTTQYPFDRLLKVIDKGIETGQIKETVFAQTGSSKYVPENFEHIDFMPFDKMVKSVQEANLVVTHAGIGTILLCLNSGKVPVIFPRLKKLGEHLDDHQLEFARHFENRKCILVAYSEEDLLNKINKYKELIDCSTDQNSSSDKSKLVHFLKTAIEKNIP